MDHIWQKKCPLMLTQHPRRQKTATKKNDTRPAAASRRRRGTPWAPGNRQGAESDAQRMIWDDGNTHETS